MTSKTVRIHFLSDVFVCCHSEIVLRWQHDVTTSPLYLGVGMGYGSIK